MGDAEFKLAIGRHFPRPEHLSSECPLMWVHVVAAWRSSAHRFERMRGIRRAPPPFDAIGGQLQVLLADVDLPLGLAARHRPPYAVISRWRVVACSHRS